jgi:hypothetical protein
MLVFSIQVGGVVLLKKVDGKTQLLPLMNNIKHKALIL